MLKSKKMKKTLPIVPNVGQKIANFMQTLPFSIQMSKL